MRFCSTLKKEKLTYHEMTPLNHALANGASRSGCIPRVPWPPSLGRLADMIAAKRIEIGVRPLVVVLVLMTMLWHISLFLFAENSLGKEWTRLSFLPALLLAYGPFISGGFALLVVWVYFKNRRHQTLALLVGLAFGLSPLFRFLHWILTD